MLRFEHKQIYLYSQPIDMRKSINGLSYIVNDLPEQSPQDGSLILFYNRSRDKVKLLYWDKNGFVMVYKRLEKGRFKVSRHNNNAQTVSLDDKQLSWLMAGLDYDLMKQNEHLDFSGFY